jgi:hypothetical protein
MKFAWKVESWLSMRMPAQSGNPAGLSAFSPIAAQNTSTQFSLCRLAFRTYRLPLTGESRNVPGPRNTSKLG